MSSPGTHDRVRFFDGVVASTVTRLLGADAVTFGSWILLSPGASRELASETEAGRRLLAHELAHVAQYERDRLLPFLLRYVADYLRGRRRGLTHAEAYGAIPYEQEAARSET